MLILYIHVVSPTKYLRNTSIISNEKKISKNAWKIDPSFMITKLEMWIWWQCNAFWVEYCSNYWHSYTMLLFLQSGCKIFKPLEAILFLKLNALASSLWAINFLAREIIAHLNMFAPGYSNFTNETVPFVEVHKHTWFGNESPNCLYLRF